MDNHITIPMLISFFFLLLIIFTTFFPQLSQSLSQPQQKQPQTVYDYSICKEQSYNCGDLSDISYPFWGQNRLSYCGAGKPFHLYCYQDTTTILLSSQNFTVLNIDTATYTIKLKRTDLSQNLCSPQYGDTYLSPTLFQYPPDQVNNITIHYNCTFSDSEHSHENSLCGPKNYTFYSGGNEDKLLEKLWNCKRHIQVPVGADFYDDHDDLERGLNSGFEVNYIVSGKCLQCSEPPAEDCRWKNISVTEKHLDSSCNYDICPDESIASSSYCPSHHKLQSINPKFEACTPQACGAGPSIKYPFWIPYQQDSFCGHPQFEITCNNNYPILKTSNYDLLVKHISYSNSSFIATNINVYEDKCPAPVYNYSLSLDQTPFTYSSENSNFSFFYNCTTEPIDYPKYEVECAKNATHYSFAVFHKEALEHKNYSSNECEFMVNAPLVLNTSVNFTSLLKMNYIDILKMGFVLNWTAPDCQHCEKSGGRCGFDNYKFICFCKDKSYLKICGDDEKANLKRKLVIGLGSAVLVALAVILAIYFYKRRKNVSYAKSYVQSRSLSSELTSKDLESGSQYFGRSQNFGVQHFTYSELEEATNYFDPTKELGEGGFGTVYYGKLYDGRSVAVKRLYENNYKRVEQFKNEVQILASLVHPNLVSLYGCTSRHSRELLLVYEYVSNGTVADHLRGKQAKDGKLTWPIRMNIALETASALKYLHISDIIHRDIKTNNILLDDHFHVKVADFGLSRLFPYDQTHVSTAPQGTPGYVDPEYHQCYQLTDKSDVYSFGVVMIELISSLPAVDITRHRHEINLASMALNRIQNQALHELVDPTLGFESDSKVKKMIVAMGELAFQCLQSSKDMRPSMDEVLESLKDIKSDGKHKSQPEVMDISSLSDDAVLLNHVPPPLSPDSNLGSTYTSNTSG